MRKLLTDKKLNFDVYCMMRQQCEPSRFKKLHIDKDINLILWHNSNLLRERFCVNFEHGYKNILKKYET